MRMLFRTSTWGALLVLAGLGLGLGIPQGPTRSPFRLVPEERLSLFLADRMKELNHVEASQLGRLLVELCTQHRLDPAFVLSLIQAESGFRSRVVSRAGAVGLMQLMPGTAKVLAQEHGIPYRGVESLSNPFLNLKLGVTYLAWLRDRYRGKSPYFHVAAYLVGPARMDALIAKKTFTPIQTKKYYDTIQRGVPRIREAIRGGVKRDV